MGGKTSIEWTEQTWNPIVGCSIVSPGCTNCYAMKMAARLEAMGQKVYRGKTKKVNGNSVWTGQIGFVEDRLIEPILRKRPTMYFVNSMSDMFHEDVPDAWLDRIFAVMALAPQHTFQILTKRAGRMLDYFAKPVERDGMIDCSRADRIGDVMLRDHDIRSGFKCAPWPLPNVWLGVSTERQQEADERIPLLLQTPAAVRFISAEPLLGPINLEPWLEWPADAYVGDKPWGCIECDSPCDCPRIKSVSLVREGTPDADGVPSWITADRQTLDWIIVGGESGQGARPMHPNWARELRDQCSAAGVKFFFKQWGNWRPLDQFSERVINSAGKHAVVRADGRFTIDTDIADPPRDVFTFNMGKKGAGRTLDGIEHNGFPQVSV